MRALEHVKEGAGRTGRREHPRERKSGERKRPSKAARSEAGWYERTEAPVGRSQGAVVRSRLEEIAKLDVNGLQDTSMEILGF